MYYKQKNDDCDYGHRKGHDWNDCYYNVDFFKQCEKKKCDNKCDTNYSCKPAHRPERPSCNICDLINWKELFKCCCEKPKPQPKKYFCCKCFLCDGRD